MTERKNRRGFQPGNKFGEATRFQPGNKLGGRKPDRVAAILNKAISAHQASQLNLTRQEVEEWEGKILTLTIDDLKKISKEQETPAYVVNVIMAIIADIKNGRTNTLDKLRDRQFGKVADKVELTGKDGEELFKGVEITEEQKERLRTILGGGQ